MLFSKNRSPLSIAIMLILATWAFTCWGYVWYATLFDDVWQELIGQSEEDLILLAQERGIYQFILTYVISFVQVLGLYFLHRISKSISFLQFQFRTLVISIFIASPVLGNEVLFAGSSEKLWIFDCLHFIFGYAGVALIFWIWENDFFLPRSRRSK